MIDRGGDRLELSASVEARPEPDERAPPLGADDRCPALFRDRQAHRLGAGHDGAALALLHVCVAEEACHPRVGGLRPKTVGRRRLDDAAGPHDRDLVAERERVGDVVGDRHHGDPDAREELLQLGKQPVVQRTVE